MFARLALAAALIGGSAAAIAEIRAIQRDVGPAAERNYALTPYDGIAVVGPYQIVVRADGPASARARGGAAVLDDMVVRVTDGTLHIEPRRRDGERIEWHGDRRAVVEVGGAGRLRQAAMTGSGGLRIDRLSARHVKLAMAGSGRLTVDQLRASSADVSIAGSGRVDAMGQADALSVSVAGSGRAGLARLATATANVSVAGTGQVDGRASRNAVISMMGNGRVALFGGARCAITRAGRGTASCA